jgi:hypothetical protein
MDRLLAGRLNELTRQNARLREAESLFLRLDAEKKMMLASLTSQAEGKSHAEREGRAMLTKSWEDFARGHAVAESNYQYEKRKFLILDKAYLAEHASFTREAGVIKRHGVLT